MASQASQARNQAPQDPTARVGPLELDIPQSIGYFGAIGLAVALGILEPPVGIFIAAIPVFKLLKRRNAPPTSRFIGAMLEGAAKPVGGDAEATVRLAPEQEPREPAPTRGQQGGEPATAGAARGSQSSGEG